MNSSFNNSINITVMQMQRKNAEADELWSPEHITMIACVFFIPIIIVSIAIAICKTTILREGSESQQKGKKKRRHSKKKNKKKKKKTTTKRKSERYVNTDGTKRSSIIERYEQELKAKNLNYSTKVEFDYSIPSSYPF